MHLEEPIMRCSILPRHCWKKSICVYSKHGGVHGAFGEHYVKTGLFDQKYHRWLLDAFDQRIEGDYGVEIIAADVDEVRKMIVQAEEFLAAARVYLEPVDKV